MTLCSSMAHRAAGGTKIPLSAAGNRATVAAFCAGQSVDDVVTACREACAPRHTGFRPRTKLNITAMSTESIYGCGSRDADEDWCLPDAGRNRRCSAGCFAGTAAHTVSRRGARLSRQLGAACFHCLVCRSMGQRLCFCLSPSAGKSAGRRDSSGVLRCCVSSDSCRPFCRTCQHHCHYISCLFTL